MKTGYGMLLAALATLAATSTPGVARANQPIDCTQGCYLITCSEQVCSLWRCDANGCRFLSNWPREWSESPVRGVQAPGAGKAPPAVAWVKVCPDGRDCDLYEVTVDRATVVGSFANPESLVRQREALRVPLPRTR